MAGENVIINIVGTLNVGETKKIIDLKLQELEKEINKLNISIKIDDKVLGTLNKFTDQMKRISEAALNTGKVIEEALMPDGTKVKRTYFDGLKGEFAESVKAAKDVAKQELASLEQVSDGFKKKTSEVTKYNAALKEVGSTIKLANENGTQTRSVNLNAQGQVTGYSDTNNVAKQEKLDEQAVQNEKQLIEQMESFRLQSIQRVQQRELEMETVQQQAIQKNMDLTRKEIEQQQQLEAEIKRQLELYQRDAQIKNTSISSRYGQNVDQTALGNQLSTVMNASPNQFSSMQELRNFTTESNIGFRELTAGIDNAHQHMTSFGDAIGMSMTHMMTFTAASTLLFGSFNFIKEGISYINELNKSLTTVAIITHQSQDQVQQLGNQYQQMGSQLNVSTTEIAASAAELIRQGLSMDEVNKRLTQITEFSKVAGISAQDATKYVTAATNSMQISAEKATDTFALLGHVSGVNAEYIASAYQKVGGSAGALGKNYAQLKFLLIDLEILTLSRGRQGASVMAA